MHSHASQSSKGKTKKPLTVIGFFAITAAMVMSVHEYPTFAAAGMQIPFFLLVTGFLWFLPVALCSAEMASVQGWQQGGVFTWVGNMLGKRLGFAAIFFQWLQITVCFITILYFMLGAAAYLFNFPALNTSLPLRFVCVVGVFWLLTLVQLLGTKVTETIAKVCFALGVLLVTLLLLVFFVLYLAGGHPLQFTPSLSGMLPDFRQFATLVVFVNFVFANMGIEASAGHINGLKNPKRSYPLVMIVLVVLSVLLNAMGGFSVAGVVSPDKLSLGSGMVQTFEGLILAVKPGLGWLVKLTCALLAAGVVGEVSSWIVGPAAGMDICSKQGLLPKRLHHPNKHGVPKRMLLVQGVVVSIWAAVLTLLGGGANLAYSAAISLTTIIYMASYILLFLSYFKLLRKPGLQRGFHVPGGMVGKIGLSAAGFAVTLFAFAIAFVPPPTVQAGQGDTFVAIVAAGFSAVLGLPFFIYAVYGKKHRTQTGPTAGE